MKEPECPICGARSTWHQFDSEYFELRSRFPEPCNDCKLEEDSHWRDFYDGPDVTQFGGKFIGKSPSWLDLRNKLDKGKWFSPLNLDE